MLADYLHADGKSFAVVAAGNGDGRKSHDIDENGADVTEIHLEGIGQALAGLKSRRGRNGSYDYIVLGECLIKCFLYESL